MEDDVFYGMYYDRIWSGAINSAGELFVSKEKIADGIIEYELDLA